MSLVDYASDEDSDIAEDEKDDEEEEEERNKSDDRQDSDSQNQSLISSSHQQSDGASHSSTSPIEKLPDASLLLDSPSLPSHQVSSSDHYSRVAAAMAESASRKRESNGSMSSHPRSKHPRGNLPHSRNVPDTVGGRLVPPQLRGRSNVVTEDIGKLFVSRRTDPSP
ncbi:uncharacterized protein LOC131250895 [Magnolia sinica]|uniref:uncharacterized protein LOC131250895 n=1 Tax=Magnolia sinica TaxID=86752 RepID=UPI0026595024|nr:uncharacterized protein LOC131250895 [Magnolia sinica]